MRKMAYEIRQRTEADYRFFRFESGGTPLLDELNHNLRIADGVLRFRIFKVDPRNPGDRPPAARPRSHPGAPSAARAATARAVAAATARRAAGGADDEPVAAPVEPVEAPRRAAAPAEAAAPPEAPPAEAPPAEAPAEPAAEAPEAPTEPAAEAPAPRTPRPRLRPPTTSSSRRTPLFAPSPRRGGENRPTRCLD